MPMLRSVLRYEPASGLGLLDPESSGLLDVQAPRELHAGDAEGLSDGVNPAVDRRGEALYGAEILEAVIRAGAGCAVLGYSL
jgi:hypothetical protein